MSLKKRIDARFTEHRINIVWSDLLFNLILCSNLKIPLAEKLKESVEYNTQEDHVGRCEVDPEHIFKGRIPMFHAFLF